MKWLHRKKNMNLNYQQIKMANDKIIKIIKTKDKLKKYESQFPANKNDEWQKKNWLSVWVCLDYHIGEYNFLWSNFSKNQTKSIT